MGQPETLATAAAVSHRNQTRNIFLVATNTSLCYLGASVLYADVGHASLCDKLGAAATICNLPSSAYLVMSALPVFVAWLFPQVRALKPIMVVSYGLLAVMGAVVAASLFLPAPTWLRLLLVIMHGAVLGGARTTAVACEFEVLGRAVAESRRGTALGLAYGVGPILAFVGSLGTQVLLTGRLGPLEILHLKFPDEFAFLFTATVPMMGLAAFFSSRYVVPLPDVEVQRQDFVTGVFGGFDQFLRNRVVVFAVVISIAVMCGLNILSNMGLYTREILGVAPADKAGLQNALRYAFKAGAGLFFGWLLTRTTPRTVVQITAIVGFLGVLWVMATPPDLFLISFGLVGAGQLFGIYVTNYILSCSPPDQMRRYMAFTMLTMLPVAPTGALFGWIVDSFGEYDRSYGFRLSFLAAAGFFVIGILWTLLIPARPRPAELERAIA